MTDNDALPPLLETTKEVDRETIVRKLRWMTYARLAVFIFLGGATAIFGVDTFNPEEARFVIGAFRAVDATDLVLFFTAGSGCVLTLIYALTLRLCKTMRSLERLAHIQVFGDALFAGLLVLLTGGTTSSFSFFFSLVIIEGAIITYRTGAFYTATFCTLLFVSIGLAEVSSIEGESVLTEAVPISEVKPVSQTDLAAAWGGLTYRILNSIVAFYSIAFMSSYLSERLRRSSKQLELNRHSLEDLRAIHENIVASIPIGVITLDRKDLVSFINSQAQLITGSASHQVLGQLAREMFPQVESMLGEEKRVENLLVAAQLGGGLVRDQHWTSVPLKNFKGRIIGHLLTVEDVTKTREMEVQVQRSERYATLGRLAATIAHEIRNPLTSIAGSIQLFGQGENRSDDEKRLMQIVVRETEALNRWITDFLTYARPVGEQRSSFDLGRDVSEALEALRYDARFSNVEVQSTIPEDAFVLADPVSIKQIVWNIVLNAVEAMEDGGKLWVEIDTSVREEFVQLRVTDTGPGIKSEHAERIFDPFFTTKTSGTGLGLATAFRLTTELGGTLNFHSLYGEGTTFYIDLPKPNQRAGDINVNSVAGLSLSDEDRQVVQSEMASRKTGEFSPVETEASASSSTPSKSG